MYENTIFSHAAFDHKCKSNITPLSSTSNSRPSRSVRSHNLISRDMEISQDLHIWYLEVSVSHLNPDVSGDELWFQSNAKKSNTYILYMKSFQIMVFIMLLVGICVLIGSGYDWKIALYMIICEPFFLCAVWNLFHCYEYTKFEPFVEKYKYFKPKEDQK